MAKKGYAPIVASTLSAVRVLYPIAAYPILAQNGHGPDEEYPILAKKGYAPKGASTLSAVRVFYPTAAYPILAKKGHTPDEE